MNRCTPYFMFTNIVKCVFLTHSKIYNVKAFAVFFIQQLVNSFLGQALDLLSTGPLHPLLHFHFQPINLVIFQGVLLTFVMRYLILRWGFTLIASVYPFGTWLPSYASGDTTGAPSVPSHGPLVLGKSI